MLDSVTIDNVTTGAVVKADGTVITKDTDKNDIATGLIVLNRVEGEDTLVVNSGTNKVYLVKADGTDVKVVPVITSLTNTDNIQSAKVVKVGTDYYVAVYNKDKDDNYALYYAKVDSSNNVTPQDPTVVSNLTNEPVYALDSQGVLYYSTNETGNQKTYRRTINDTQSKEYSDLTNADQIIPLANGALAKGNTKYYLLPSTGNTATDVSSQFSADSNTQKAFDICSTQYAALFNPKYSLKTEKIIGKGTNTLMCTDSNSNKFAYLTYSNGKFDGKNMDKVTYNDGTQLYYKISTQNSMIFVDTNNKILATCTVTGCSSKSTDPQTFNPSNAIKTADNVLTKADTIYYLKAAYKEDAGEAPYIVDLGSQNPVDTNTLNIQFASSATPNAGNVSLRLDKVATVYQPLNPQCKTGYDNIAYKDATTSNAKPIDKRPDDKTCFINVLQVR